MIEKIDIITQQIDSLLLGFLGPLRTQKKINQEVYAQLTQAIDSLMPLLEQQALVPKNLVGKLWFIFTSMLSEAEHAKEQREQIEAFAWDLQERLRKLFGPHF